MVAHRMSSVMASSASSVRRAAGVLILADCPCVFLTGTRARARVQSWDKEERSVRAFRWCLCLCVREERGDDDERENNLSLASARCRVARFVRAGGRRDE